MPTNATMVLPIPDSPSEFEKICKDVLEIKYGKSFSLYGRVGQTQNGIDITSSDGTIVAQCKNYYKQNYDIFIRNVKRDYSCAKSYFNRISCFIVMTTLNSDTKALDELTQLGNNTAFMFWEDIRPFILDNVVLFKRYYPSLYLANNNECQKIKDCDFIDKFITVCLQNKMEDMLLNLTYNGGFIDDYLDYCDNFISSANQLLSSTESVSITPEIIAELKHFTNLFNSYSTNVFICLKPNFVSRNEKSVAIPLTNITTDFKKGLDETQITLNSLYQKYRFFRISQ